MSDPVRTRVFASTLALAPAVLLFALSWSITPVFAGKYLIWSSLGAALLLGGAVALLRSPRRRSGVIAGVLATVLLVSAALATGIRLSNPPPRGDDFPAAARAIAESAAIGDALVVAQPYAFGGVAYGMASAAGDAGYATEIRDHAVAGSQPTLDSRLITAVSPLRSDAAASPGRASGATWVLTIFPITDAQLSTVEADVAGCLRTLDFERPTERYGALRLFRLDCA